MRKTKIICSIGPACWSTQGLTKLFKAGMNVARLNFSHGKHEQYVQIIKRIRAIDPSIAIMLDTKGPEVRTGKVENDEIILRTGKTITITTDQIIGSKEKISISYPKVDQIVERGDLILIEDGLIELEVKSVKKKEVLCKINVGGPLGNTKNVNFPGKDIDLPAFSKKDINDILFGIKNDIDIIAASFVRTKQDIIQIKRLLKKHKQASVKVIAKIEHQKALDHIDEIIDAADGVMIARGDLGVQILQEEVPIIQKEILHKCREAAKPCIVATQMLDSMIHRPRPTRAEVTDVANAILDGADAVMLSGETAKGQFPTKAVETMAAIAKRAETLLKQEFNIRNQSISKTHALSKLAVIAGEDLNASAIIVPTKTGNIVRTISSQKPLVPILAFATTPRIARQLQLSFAVIPFQMQFKYKTDSTIQKACQIAYKQKFVLKKDLVVIAAAHPSINDATNLLEIREVGDIISKQKSRPHIRIKHH